MSEDKGERKMLVAGNSIWGGDVDASKQNSIKLEGCSERNGKHRVWNNEVRQNKLSCQRIELVDVIQLFTK